jgi:outer membrane biosynthesis protein TonB
MSTVTGILGGSLVLATAQLLLSSQNATTAYGKLATVPAAWLQKFMDAGVAAIPDHSITAPAAAGSAAPSAAPVSAIPPPNSVPAPSSPTTLSV